MYNAQAESYGINSPYRGQRFFAVLEDLWCWDDGKPFRISECIGKCPSIQHLAPKTQGDILRVVLRDVLNPPPGADGFVRVGKIMYRYCGRSCEMA